MSKWLAVAFVFLAPLSAAAQNQGPMIVERVPSGFVFAPDAKVTDADHRTSELIGGNLGWAVDQTVFVGGGGYWLVNNSHDTEMGYGGFVFQWLGGSTDRFGWGVKALIGGGSATLTDTVSVVVPVYPPMPTPYANGRPDVGRLPPPTYKTVSAQVRVHDDFFVAEPELDVRLRLSKHARLTAGIGYRAATGNRHDDGRLMGAVGSVGIQFGGGL